MIAAGGRHAGARLEALRLHLRRLPQPRLRLRAHGGDQPRQHARWPARTPASASARTAHRRWRSRTWPRCAPSTAAPSSTRRDANQTAAARWPQMADREGIVYMRTTREKTPVLYEPGEAFHDRRRAGGALRRRRRRDPRRRRHHAARGAQGRRRAGRRRHQRPRHRPATRSSRSTPTTLRGAARETGAIITVEDHWPEGGIGDAVLDALADASRPPPVVREAGGPRSCRARARRRSCWPRPGIDAAHIAAARSSRSWLAPAAGAEA